MVKRRVSAGKEKCLVSACLLGLCTRYDGRSKPSEPCLRELAEFQWIPVCPEQLGGLPTPRVPAYLTGGDGADVLAGRASVRTRDGRDVTGEFVRGARQCLELARLQGATRAFLKSGSPSCGAGRLLGVTAALLREHSLELKEF